MASGPPQEPPEHQPITSDPASPVPGLEKEPPFEPVNDDQAPETPDSPPAKPIESTP